MNTTIVYDHFIAKGGAENVSIQLADALEGARVETAYAEHRLFESALKSKKLTDLGLKKRSTSALIVFYLLFYSVPKHFVFVSGIFSPLCLLRAGKRTYATVYFHMFPVFVHWSFRKIREERGLIGALINKLFISLYVQCLKLAVKKARVVWCNSAVTQNKFAGIGISAKVLYPPVSLSGLQNKGDKNFFLSTCRLEKEKRVELILETFSTLPNHQLKMVGGGPLYSELSAKYGNYQNIEFCGWKERNEILDDYNYCKSLICIPENEAFGIAAVEAMAAGKPVLGVAEGGLQETIVDSKLGTLLSLPLSKTKLKNAIIELSGLEDIPSVIEYRRAHALQFDEQYFYQKINKLRLDLKQDLYE